MCYISRIAAKFFWLSALSLLLCASTQAMRISNNPLPTNPPPFRAAVRASIEKDNIVKQHLLEKGAFGDVWKAKLKVTPNTDGIEVAVKYFHLKTQAPHLASEFEPYYALADKSGHIAQFHGICDTPGNFAMVMEYFPYSLAKFYANYFLSWDNIYNFGEQIAQALAFLHKHGFGHKHLKSSNVFVTKDLTIKVADFGLSRLKLEASSNGAARTEATVRWRAPETFTREYARIRDSLEVQKPADMFSYGLLLWEMATRHRPFHTYSEAKVVELLNLGTREAFEFTWPTHFRTLLNNLWSFIPTSRPNAEQVLKMLNGPEFKLNEAKLAPVLGYKFSEVEEGYTRFLQPGGSEIRIQDSIVSMCSVLKENILRHEKRPQGKYAEFPREVDVKVWQELYRVLLLPQEEWPQELVYLEKAEILPGLVNAAGTLGAKDFFHAGCKFAAEMLRRELAKNPEPKYKKTLLPTREEEESQQEFEQLMLAAIRAKIVEK